MATDITSLLSETTVIPPPMNFRERARIRSEEEYSRLYRESIEDPIGFWNKQAHQELQWRGDFDEVLRGNEWFVGGTLNASENCLDRHLNGWRRTKAALIWQGEKVGEQRSFTYGQLHAEVCRCAHVLKGLGVKKGTVVTLYMPMIPELMIAMLACARLGAVHSVVFSAFSASALCDRIQPCAASVVVTADSYLHAGKEQRLKSRLDDALASCPTVKKVLVVRRSGEPVEMLEGRDVWWHEQLYHPRTPFDIPAEPMAATDPLFILYTSGSTGVPKEVRHATGGYLLWAHLTFKYVFDYRDDDLYWSTADIGWITGHSYTVYGPLSNGATVLMYEGAPAHPLPDRLWQIVDQYKVSTFYTAPTAIRSLMRMGDDWPAGCDLSSLRLLGSVGEPINSEAWLWYFKHIGGERCPVVDTWWQTETGGIMITTLPGVHEMKPGAAGKPFFGIAPELLDDEGKRVSPGHGGALTVTKPWPGMMKGVPEGAYVSGDSCRQDDEGYYWLMGRMDDVLNVAAHRFSTAEIESALDSHEGVAEAAVVGVPHETKGQGIYCFVTLKAGFEPCEELREQLVQQVRTQISPIATPHHVRFAPGLPKTRSGKILRRMLRAIAVGEEDLGDTSTLADPSVVKQLTDSA